MKKSLFITLTLLLSLFAGEASANIKQTRIYAEDCTTTKGELFSIPIKYDGNVNVSVAVFYFIIPEGFSFPESTARKNVQLAEAFADLGFSVSANILNGNELRVTIEDPDQVGIDAESGLLANVLVKAGENTAAGDYTFKLTTISASDANAGNYKTPDQEFTVTVANKYSVSVTSTDETMGTVAIDPVQDEYLGGTSVTATATAAEGYHFVKWSDEATANPYTFAVEADTELTATFAPNQYTATFVLGNGEENVVLTQDYKSALTAPTPTRTGYTLAGWEPAVPETMPLDGGTYTAQWTVVEYPITYNYSGGTAEGNPSSYTVETETFTLVNPTMRGYTFAGWKEIYSGEDRGLTVTIEKGSTGRLYFQASWTRNTYHITYNLDGGTVEGENPATFDVETETFTLVNPTKTGYTFAGWTGTGLTAPTPTVTIAKGSIDDREYTATWTVNTYKVTWVVDGQSTETSVVYGEAITAPADPEKEGYTFAGWTPAVPATMPAADQTFTAQWTLNNYTITYVLGDGEWETGVVAPTSYTIESAEIVIPQPKSTKDGYEFIGWTTETSVTPVKPWVIAAGSTGNVTLTAVYDLSTGIQAVVAKAGKADVYTIDGRLVKRGITADELQQLPRGLYIVGGKKVNLK